MKAVTKGTRKKLLTVTLRVLLALAVGAALFFVYQVGRATLVDNNMFELERITYQGMRHCDKQSLTDLIQQRFGRNTLLIDLKELRELVEGEVWVKAAVVRRKLPNELIIQLTERRPVAVAAIEDGLYVVDDDGVVLDQYEAQYDLFDRPIVKGLRNLARENALTHNADGIKTYLRVIEELKQPQKDYTSEISEVDVGDPQRVAVVPTDEPVPVYLGNEGFRKRYETFLSQKDLYFELKEKYGLIEYVDVSYESKIIFHTPNQSLAG